MEYVHVIVLSLFISKLVGQMLETNFHELYKNFFFPSQVKLSDSPHILYEEYQLLPSNRRLRVRYARMNGLRKSFVHQSVKLLNQNRGLNRP